MARLSSREIDAVVDTVVKQIYEYHENSPEQIEYQRKLQISKDLDKECALASKKVVHELMKEYQEKYPEMEFSIYDCYNRIDCEEPNEPSFKVSKRDIEREIIVANISGDVQETITELVTKYTK